MLKEPSLWQWMRKHSVLRTLLAVGLVAVLVASAFMITLAPAAVTRTIGASVEAVGDPQVFPSSIAAKETPEVKPPFTNVEALSPVVSVTPGGKLKQKLTLRFKLNRKVTPGELVLVATSETASGPWQVIK